MKTLLNSVIVGLAGTLCLGVFNTRANLEISTSVHITAKADFHTPLSAHGVWVDVDSYGRCWRPGSVAVEWQPYSYGHWVWTDCGWYWASDEPWGWACYHYGRWVHHSHHGWVWVPDTEWAPAWVSWRVGGGYVGWAPMAPRFGVFVSVPAPPFFFVEIGRFHEPVRPSRVIVNNTTIINKTTVINNMKSETRNFGDSGPRKVMINEGPGLAGIEKATGKKVQQVPIQEAMRRTPAPQGLERKTGEKSGGPTEKTKPSSGTDRPKAAPSPRPERSESPGSPPKPGSPDKEKGPPRDSDRDRSQAAPSPRPDRNESPGLPPKLGPQGKDKEPREGVVPSPERPLEKPSKSGKEKGKGRGSDRF